MQNNNQDTLEYIWNREKGGKYYLSLNMVPIT